MLDEWMAGRSSDLCDLGSDAAGFPVHWGGWARGEYCGPGAGGESREGCARKKRAKKLPILILTAAAPAAQRARSTLSDDPDKAWEEVDKIHQALRPPDNLLQGKADANELEKFRKQLRASSEEFAGKAREFMKAFPTNENVGEARLVLVDALNHAMMSGDTNAERQITSFVSSVVADKNIPEDQRVELLLFAGNTPMLKGLGMRFFTEEKEKLHRELDTAAIQSARAALKRFPGNVKVFNVFLAAAQDAEGEKKDALAWEVFNAPDAPDAVKKLAEHILKRTRPYEVGRPLEIQFTALDGREVNLAKLKGKVILVEFWSTTCGPCVGRMPEVKSVYEKYQADGFEIVGISLDDKEGALRRFIKEKELRWPQHFDGKGWENKFALAYGIYGIPTMWLLDKRGDLRYLEAEAGLEGLVKSLIDEK